MSRLRHFFVYNIARFNRLRRKPFQEIITYIKKRSKTFRIHCRDRIRILINTVGLTDKQLFQKMELTGTASSSVKAALMEGNITKAKKGLLSHMRSRVTPYFFFNANEKGNILQTLEKHFKYSKKQAIRSAEEICNHSFHILGKDIQFTNGIDWHSTIDSNRRWPLTFSPNIDYFSDNRIGDIKLAWELNRMQHFVTLGKAFWFTHDDKYFEEWKNQFVTWIDNNPYKLGINWNEGIECAIRIISWIWAHFFFLESQSFNEELHLTFLKSLYSQTKFIEEHLSDKWQLNNNHIIAEAVGLIYTGVLFPEFIASERWRSKGYRILETELSKQILPDGVSWEQSTGYHRFVTDLCLHALLLAQKNHIQVSPQLLFTLERMVGFLNQITKMDGRLPLIGDADDARVVKLDDSDYDDARSTITLGSILFENKEWSRTRSEEVFWLVGDSALVNERQSVYQKSGALPDSGYYLLRNRDKYMLLFTGPLKEKYVHSGHRHLDMLSFSLCYNDVSFIVDPGTYTYYGAFEWRKYFKGLKAHNAVVIDDRNPIEINEIFELSNMPLTQIHNHMTNSKYDWIVTSHKGYNSVTHTRKIFFLKSEYWILIDLLEGHGEHVYDLYFHFNHDIDLKYGEGNKHVTATYLNRNLYLLPFDPGELESSILTGSVSPRYGIKEPASVLRFRRQGETPKLFVTVLYPSIDTRAPIHLSRLDVFDAENVPFDTEKVTGVCIDLGKYKDYFVCSHIGDTFLNFNDFHEIGQMIYQRIEDHEVLDTIVI